ncbi:ankyrin, partial [Hypoxylon sp. EC38]
VVDWLMRQPDQTPLNLHRHQNELLRQIARGTGQWILETEEFLAWKDISSPLRLLWMHGIPFILFWVPHTEIFSLSSLIIDSLEREIKSTKDVACVYFYFQEGEKHQVSFARIWATLLEQLLRASGDLAGKLKAKFDDSFQGSIRPNSSEYLELFIAQAATIKTVYLVIDALDKCQNTSEEDTQQKMQDALKTLPGGIRVLFTSRNDSASVEVGANLKLTITPQRQDVEIYIKKRIEDSKLLRIALGKDLDRDYVITNVADMTLASNMFLLARLHMDNLSKRGTLSDIKNALGQHPASAFKIFNNTSARRIAQEINDRSNNFETALVKHILTWVIHAKTELTAQQICDSFAIRKSGGQLYHEHRPRKELLIPACNGLVIMDSANETLNLVHKSVQKYLQNHSIIPENSNLEITKTCLYCLLSDACDQENGDLLLQYAAKYWWAHLSHPGHEIDSEAQYLALNNLTDLLASQESGLDILDARGNTALLLATRKKRSAAMTSLLRYGALCNVADPDGRTALHYAAALGFNKALSLLLDKSFDGDPNAMDGKDSTPLHLAINDCYVDAETVGMLVKAGANMEARDKDGRTPLMLAAQLGREELVRSLLIEGADPQAQDGNGWMVVSYARDFLDI